MSDTFRISHERRSRLQAFRWSAKARRERRRRAHRSRSRNPRLRNRAGGDSRSRDLFPRRATSDDIPGIRALIARSARELSVGFYTPEQVEAAITYVFGVDTQLIADGTYLVIDSPDGLAAAGGWSARRTLFGGDQMKGDEDPRLDPATDAARIRAFFVDPRWARRGLARALYDACAQAAAGAGFHRLELMATAPGEPVYERLGFTVLERVEVSLPSGIAIPFARMARSISSDAPAH